MKVASWLSLLICLVSLSQAQEILKNGGFGGCDTAQDPIPNWSGGYGTVPTVEYARFFSSVPPGDECLGVLIDAGFSDLEKVSQTIEVPRSGSYDFVGLVSCINFNGAGTCPVVLTIGGKTIPFVPQTLSSPGRNGNTFVEIKALGIGLVRGSQTFELKVSTTSFTKYVCISYLSLRPFAFGFGDPHMVGFHGQRFDYYGEAGQVVNMLSDPALQVNTLLGMQKQSANMYFDGPVMMEMVFLTRSHTISVNAGGYLKEETGFVRVDGELLALGQSLSFSDDKISVSFSAFSAIAKDLGLDSDDNIVAKVDVEVEGLFEFTVFMVENGRDPKNPDEWLVRIPRRFLNFKASLLDQNRRPHGVIGQTAAPLSKERSVEDWRIEGKDSDYVVKDGLTGSLFAFNQFN